MNNPSHLAVHENAPSSKYPDAPERPELQAGLSKDGSPGLAMVTLSVHIIILLLQKA